MIYSNMVNRSENPDVRIYEVNRSQNTDVMIYKDMNKSINLFGHSEKVTESGCHDMQSHGEQVTESGCCDFQRLGEQVME